MAKDTEKAEWTGPFSPAEVEGVGTVAWGEVVDVPVGTTDSNHWQKPGGEAKADKPEAKS